MSTPSTKKTPMNAIQARLESPRFQRTLLWLGALVLVAGIALLISRFVGGSDTTSVQPAKNFHPTLPTRSYTLKNRDGVVVKHYAQLDPQIKANIRTFIATAVARRDLGRSWDVVAPSLKRGYTKKSWSHASALPIVPYPVAKLGEVSYTLRYATNKEILADVGLTAPSRAHMRPTTFAIGLVPSGHGVHKWLVNYWMPRWSPLIPQA
jgi:hypothetical protein